MPLHAVTRRGTVTWATRSATPIAEAAVEVIAGADSPKEKKEDLDKDIVSQRGGLHAMEQDATELVAMLRAHHNTAQFKPGKERRARAPHPHNREN